MHIIQGQWCPSVVLATLEPEVGGSLDEPRGLRPAQAIYEAPSQILKTKNKIKKNPDRVKALLA